MLHRERFPWNKGRLVGQTAPLKLKDIRAIRVRLQIGHRTRELALFNLAIDSKLRSCDLVRLRVREVCHGNVVAARTIVMQQKTQRPVQFEITEQTRDSLAAWIRSCGIRSDDYLFPSRLHSSPHLSTLQYARIVRVLGGQSLRRSTAGRSLRNAAAGAHAVPRRTPGPAQSITMI
jgi:integrase